MSEVALSPDIGNGAPHLAPTGDHLELFLHDVRTPLAVVMAVLETLLRHDGELDAETRLDLVGRATDQATVMRRLMSGFEEFQRLESGVVEVDRVSVAVDELVADVLAQEEPGVGVVLRLRPTRGRVDVGLLRRAVCLLIDNVAMHTPLGTTMTLSTEPAPRGVLITVEDDGQGVPADLRERIFEPFERGMAPRHRGGIGLGLAIVRSIARRHDGRAWAEESAAGGLRVRLLVR